MRIVALALIFALSSLSNAEVPKHDSKVLDVLLKDYCTSVDTGKIMCAEYRAYCERQRTPDTTPDLCVAASLTSIMPSLLYCLSETAEDWENCYKTETNNMQTHLKLVEGANNAYMNAANNICTPFHKYYLTGVSSFYRAGLEKLLDIKNFLGALFGEKDRKINDFYTYKHEELVECIEKQYQKLVLDGLKN